MGIIIGLLNYAVSALIWIILIRVILSWIRIDPYVNPVVRLIYEVSEVLLAPVRRLLPPVGFLDFSPFVVILVLELIRRII